MLRVVMFGSYKKPREVTWMTGVVLLLVILAFALTGYLLPWDQKAYWATTVTINIARSTPIFGEQVASLMRGGADLGALTLLRWYTAHVFLLPAALVGFVLAHLYLMRRHGISGPTRGSERARHRPFYPYQAIKDTVAMAAVFALLLTFALDVSRAARCRGGSVGRDLHPTARVVFPEPVSVAEVLSGTVGAGRHDRHPWARRGRPTAVAISRSRTRTASS